MIECQACGQVPVTVVEWYTWENEGEAYDVEILLRCTGCGACGKMLGRMAQFHD